MRHGIVPENHGYERDFDIAYDQYRRCLAKDMPASALDCLDRAIDAAHPLLLPQLAAERRQLAAKLKWTWSLARLTRRAPRTAPRALLDEATANLQTLERESEHA